MKQLHVCTVVLGVGFMDSGVGFHDVLGMILHYLDWHCMLVVGVLSVISNLL